MSPIPPGATIGILGGGQLGRMTAMAAARLGYRCHILAPEADSPAADVAAAFTCAGYDDEAALRGVRGRGRRGHARVRERAGGGARASWPRTARSARAPPCCGSPRTGWPRRTSSRRWAARSPAYARVESAADLAARRDRLGPGVLKTTRLGYDGKGQLRVDAATDPAAAVAQLGQPVLIHEAWVDFALELSVITARNPQGEVASYVPVENRHRHHILDVTVAPAAIPAEVAAEAVAMAERIAAALELEGLLAVEMFLTRDGRLLVNELAPRPHNSGHWTIDACAVSQFEQQVRAVCGLPLGDPARFADAEMTNLIGDEVDRWPELLAEPGARLHLYGKREARPGRKMGHVTRLRR